jgi:hypothetical protein
MLLPDSSKIRNRDINKSISIRFLTEKKHWFFFVKIDLEKL